MKALMPGKQRQDFPVIIGFDIETYGPDNGFVMAVLAGDGWRKTFKDKDSFIRELKRKRYRHQVFCATNLQFDFMGVFFGDKALNHFQLIEKQGSLLAATTYVYGGEFHRKKPCKDAWRLQFLDSRNYCMFSVKNLAKTIGMEKLPNPCEVPGRKASIKGSTMEAATSAFRRPETAQDWLDLERYCHNDAEITRRFMAFFFDSIRKLGGSFRLTIAATALSIFRNRYLDRKISSRSRDILDVLFKAYYGGRVECFQRGLIKSSPGRRYRLYDINSLYPSVMLEQEYPDPSSLHIVHKDSIRYIMESTGVSRVRVECPEGILPLLPYRKDDKLLFPSGTFEGYYTHAELRRAMSEGYIITKVMETYYYSRTMRPFKAFVEDFYSMRLRYKQEGSPMELVCKLIMNSLYGKFGERYDDRKEMQPFDFTMEQLEMMPDVERFGDFIYMRKASEPKVHCIPEWALHVTAYGRLKLYDYLKLYNPVYCDTDSIITHHELPESKSLGMMKLEHYIDEMVIVRPKFYAIRYDGVEKVKCKGLPFLIRYQAIKDGISVFNYQKLAKFREAVRRGLKPNQALEAKKRLSYMDTKRIFFEPFSVATSSSSIPVKLIDGMDEEDAAKAEAWWHRKQEMEVEEFLKSDLFDSRMMDREGYDAEKDKDFL